MRLLPVHRFLMRSFAIFGLVLAGISALRMSRGASDARHLLLLGLAITVLCVLYLRFAPHLRDKP